MAVYGLHGQISLRCEAGKSTHGAHTRQLAQTVRRTRGVACERAYKVEGRHASHCGPGSEGGSTKWAGIHAPMRPVVPGVLEHKEESDLRQDLCPTREGNLVHGHAKVFCQGVETPDLRQFDGEVSVENVFRALPLLLGAWNLVLCSKSRGVSARAQAEKGQECIRAEACICENMVSGR
jgi:hypothetical protein